MFFAAEAVATPITISTGPVGSGGILLGFDHLNIGGNDYDFRIADGTCADIFGIGTAGGTAAAGMAGGPCNANAFAFNTQADAIAANTALLAAIVGSGWDHLPAQVFDSGPGNPNNNRVIWTPFGENPGSSPVGILTEHLALATDALSAVTHANSSVGNNGVWGVFTPIPEPSTLALFGAGLAGLGAVHRRRKVKA
jgi:hypothetical protein